MFKQRQNQKYSFSATHSKPIDLEQVTAFRIELKSIHRNYLNYIAGLFILAIGVSYRVMSLDFAVGLELFEVSITIGLWLGLFTGFMANGDKQRRIKISIVSICVSSSASVLAAMLVVLFQGYMESWVMSVNILASALGSMWVLVYYDEVIKSLESLEYVNEKQYLFVEKAASHFEELELLRLQIEELGRKPLLGEYWAVVDWIQKKANFDKQ